MLRRTLLALAPAALLGALVAGCDRPASSSATPRAATGAQIRCTATVGMVGDLVRAVGGERVSVTQLLAPGTDPHTYKPSLDDDKALRSADLVFYSGLHLEGTMSEALHALPGATAVAEAIPAAMLIHDGAAEGGAMAHDPHVWNDLKAWGHAADATAKALAAKDPAHAAEYTRRAADYKKELELLDLYCAQALASIPEGQRVLVTQHDAFAYFGRAYKLEVLGIQGISTADEASLKHMGELVDTLVARKIPAVFVESSCPKKQVQALIEGAAEKKHAVALGGELFSDAMGAEGTWEGTFIGMIDHNATTIANALGGKAEGFQTWRKNQSQPQAK